MSCLNNWDVQSKHVYTVDGVMCALYSGECRYGGGEAYVVYPVGNEARIIVKAYDIYNFADTGNVGRTLSTSGGGLNEYIPVVVIEVGNENIPESDRGIVCEQPSGELHRSGRVQRHAPGNRKEQK